MSKSKLDFISEILTNKKLEPQLKDKFISLAATEIKKIGLADQALLIEIENLKKNIEVFKKEKKSKPKREKQKKHAPKDVAEFMSLFNKKEGLKYFTHDFDEDKNFDIESFLKISKNTFDKNTRKYSIPKYLFSLIQNFCFELTPEWDFERVKKTEGWSSQLWIDWSNTNRLHPSRNSNFRSIISAFRELIRIDANSTKNDNLKNIIQEQLELGLGKNYSLFKIKIDPDISKADFYTDIQRLKNALLKIFELISKNTTFSEIEISYLRDNIDDYYIRRIEIFNKDSYPPKEFNLLIKEWVETEKGDMGEIKKNLFGYCDWSVITKIENTPYQINILKDAALPIYTVVDNALGFKHILTFYYK